MLFQEVVGFFLPGFGPRGFYEVAFEHYAVAGFGFPGIHVFYDAFFIRELPRATGGVYQKGEVLAKVGVLTDLEVVF